MNQRIINKENFVKIFSSLFIGCILIFSLSFTKKQFASTWAGTASNQTVSRNALANAVGNAIFYERAAFSGSTRQVTKAEAAAWVYLDETASPFSGKSSNQLVIKSDLVAKTPITVQFASSYDGIFGLDIQVCLSSALPAATTIYFEWCTNTSATGEVTFSLPSGFSGCATALVNCSSFGAFSGTYYSGNVTATTGSVVNDFHIKGATFIFTTTDNTRPYLLSYPNVDNACSNPTTVVDECVNCY